MQYRTIKEDATKELTIKKSRFITVIKSVSSLDEAETELRQIRQIYAGANHYCFACRVKHSDQIRERYSDDGEPSGTAGWPILNVIKNNGLQNVLAIVVRYFGGTLLGTGGLVKAYTQSVQTCLDTAGLVIMEHSHKITVTLEYRYWGSFEKNIQKLKHQLLNVQFTELVEAELWIPSPELENLLMQTDNLTLGSASVKVIESDFVSLEAKTSH